MTNAVHDFDERLAMSEAAKAEPFWLATYEAAFTGFVSATRIAGPKPAQYAGIDRIVVLESGRAIYVDEKVRETDYGDLLLEVVSNDRTEAKGWIEKDLLTDYIAYGILPARRAYLLPWEPLRCAWSKHGREWKRLAKNKSPGFRVVRARNRGYSTWSVAVPTARVLDAVREALIVDLPSPLLTGRAEA